MIKKERQENNKQQNKFNELKHYVREGVVRYDFFEATDKITVVNSISADKEVVGVINKGDALMRVGDGLVCGNLPIETMYLLKYDKLFKQGFIKRITDPTTAIALADAFKTKINQVELKVTSDVLTYLTSYEEFIRVPQEILPNIKTQINNIFK